MITLKNVHWEADEHTLIHDVSMVINPGELVCLTGPLSSGKTPLLKLIAGLQLPHRGSVSFDGINVQHVPEPGMQILRKKIAYVGSNPLLPENMSVEEAIAYPLRLWSIDESEVLKRVSWLSHHLGLDDVIYADAGSLPHGRQILVAIARALALQPIILILDEPWAPLSDEERTLLTSLLGTLHEKGVTLICGTEKDFIPSNLSVRVIALHRGAVLSDSLEPTLSATEAKALQEESKQKNDEHISKIIDDAMNKITKKPRKGSVKKVPITALRST